jgi:hypothetical protein
MKTPTPAVWLFHPQQNLTVMEMMEALAPTIVLAAAVVVPGVPGKTAYQMGVLADPVEPGKHSRGSLA